MIVIKGSFGDALRVWEEALSLTPADATLWELKVRPLVTSNTALSQQCMI